MPADICSHLEALTVHDGIVGTPPDDQQCTDCLAIGGHWVHLRRCTSCGHVACCDSSPNQHATAHASNTGHAVVQSFEPGEDWLWCYADEVIVDTAGPSPSHP